MSEADQASLPTPPPSQHRRPLSLAVFENEKSVAPMRSGERPWEDVITLHRDRSIRAAKSGLMLGGYALNGKRNDANAQHRSVIQLDVDSEVSRDKVTGDILAVTRRAPSIFLIGPNIEQFEWVAASTHSHNPDRGIVRYRICLLPSRNIAKDEHLLVLEALDELLCGALDRAAWAWSQAFYLPSCPPECAPDAFFIHNPGVPVPVDELVTRGRQILASRQRLGTNLDRRSAPAPRSIPETPENVSTVSAMLAVTPADGSRDLWRQVVWAVCSLGWDQGEQLVRDWSKSVPRKYDAADFDKVVMSYDRSRPDAIGPRTLDLIARSHGYQGPSLSVRPVFDGKGFDVANGKAFATMHRDRLLYVSGAERWLTFDPATGWVVPPPGEADRAAKQVLEALKADRTQQSASGADEGRLKLLGRHIEYSSRAQSIRAMIEMAKSESGMTVRLHEFDADPMLLGLTNGVLDLRTGSLQPASPKVLVSKRCGVAFDPAASCLTFEQFLGEVIPDPNMRAFLQRLVGYLLTGEIREQVFAFLHGSGSNGKSVFVETVAWLLGDYALKIPTEMLMEHRRNPQGPSPDIVALKGVRLAFASETEERHRLSAARVKELTGGDTLTGRLPHAKAAVTFSPTHKLVIVGNYKPEISDMSPGMWRRIMLIGFDQTIPEAQRDHHLLDRLKQEGSGILNWALAGLRDWRKVGLRVPPSIRHATAAYRDEQDIIGEWLADNCNALAGATTRKDSLYLDHKLWAVANGHHPLAQNRLTRRLGDRGYKLDKGRRNISGLELKAVSGRNPI